MWTVDKVVLFSISILEYRIYKLTKHRIITV